MSTKSESPRIFGLLTYYSRLGILHDSVLLAAGLTPEDIIKLYPKPEAKVDFAQIQLLPGDRLYRLPAIPSKTGIKTPGRFVTLHQLEALITRADANIAGSIAAINFLAQVNPSNLTEKDHRLIF